MITGTVPLSKSICRNEKDVTHSLTVIRYAVIYTTTSHASPSQHDVTHAVAGPVTY